MGNNIETKSLHKLKTHIGERKRDFNISSNESFYVVKQNNSDYYVEPLLSYIETGFNTEYDKAHIILISAPGATGKSEMTKNLSNGLNIPVFDLGKHDAVGANSFIGMLYKVLNPIDMGKMLNDISTGEYTVIIDALDEGYTKTKSPSAFEAFLKDIANIAVNATGLPFIIFGRTSVLEYATLFFEEQGVKTSLLQIEPFTLSQAKQFIDNSVKTKIKSIFDKAYKDVRDQILESIKGFFKSESEIKSSLYKGFIGYAPVLQSIAELIGNSTNYIDLQNHLKEGNEQGIRLINRIIECILNRERQKLLGKDGDDGLLGKDLLCKRDVSFKTEFKAKAYTSEEQYTRLLYRCLNENDFHTDIMPDKEFNKEYDKSVNSWLDEHPFRNNNNNTIVNIVFEAFILVNLMKRKEYTDKVLSYLSSIGNGSYMLYNLFAINKENTEIDSRYVPYLIESFQSMDRGESRGKVIITSAQNITNSGEITLEIEFLRDNDEKKLSSDNEYSVRCTIKKGDAFKMPRVISNLLVDAENLDIEMSDITTEFSAPVNITAKTVKMYSKDFQFRALDNRNSTIEINCETFESQSNFGGMQSIYSIGTTEDDIRIISQNTIYFPFVNYRQTTYFNSKNDEAIDEKYQKMRRIILHFHSYKGGELAKYKAKIDNRIGCTTIGNKVLEALKCYGIIETIGAWYYINKNKLDEFGIDFNKIRSTEINNNEKLKEFLNGIS